MWWLNSIVGSPKQEHKEVIEKTVDNINEFPEYFNNLFSKEKNKDDTAQSRIENDAPCSRATRYLSKKL